MCVLPFDQLLIWINYQYQYSAWKSRASQAKTGHGMPFPNNEKSPAEASDYQIM
jgi:hypothetical protein